ncbi:MAG: glutamine amidotransferase [Deferribacterales bacterium]
MFLLLKTGSSIKDLACHYGDFDDWMIRFMSVMRQMVKVVDVQKHSLPETVDFDGILVTGAHEMVTDRHRWSEDTAAYLKKAVEAEIPVFGVCYGHQLLAHALGGVVGNHPKGPEIGTVEVTLTDDAKTDPIFKKMPKKFMAHVTHTQSVLTLPEEAVVLASNSYEPVEAFRVGKNAWGVQFHPEYDTIISREYAIFQKEKLKDVDKVLSSIQDTPEANSMLERFVDYCTE